MFGLLWLAGAIIALAATATVAFAVVTAIAPPVSDPNLYALAGGSLILLGLVRSRRKE